MKTAILFLLLLTINNYPQNWPTTGGNNQRNGLTEMTGPVDINTAYWTITSSNSLWGNSVFTNGDKFITSRVVFSPVYSAKLECRSLTDGTLYWEKVLNDSAILYAVGFNDFAVYVHDYKTGLLYSLSPEDGSVNWSIEEYMFGGKAGIIFACNGDPVVKGKRLNKYTGEVIWNYNYTIPVGPDAGYAMYGNTYYHWEGSIVTPKTVFALDAETGVFKYESAELPGDGDQEYPLNIGADGTIYIPRDGGLLYAIEDNGTALNIKWTYDPVTEVKGYFGSDSSGNIYIIDGGRIRRLNKTDGSVMDTSLIEIITGFIPSITVDAEGNVYAGTADAGPGKYYCLSPDLQTLIWEKSLPYNYYAGPSIGKEGVMVLIGSGTQISAYKNNAARKPAADFYADRHEIMNGESINFFNRSSYAPENFEWHFDGGTPSVSSDMNPQNIVYYTEGIYSVKLTASNTSGVDSLVRECFITVELWTSAGNDIQNPGSFYLEQNYPNPFNPVTTIIYQIPQNHSHEITTLKVYDMLGNEIAVLVDEHKSSGSYEVSFDASLISSGMYFYELKSGNSSSVRKMLLVK